MKRFLFFLCALALMASAFVSCSSDDDDDSGGGGNYVVPCPKFSPIGGFYKSEQTVTISCADSNNIFYTILKPTLDADGNWDETAWQNAVAASKPDENSTKYEEPFQVNEQCIIRACAVKGNGTKNYAMTAFDFDLNRENDATSQKPTLVSETATSGAWSSNWQDQSIYFILTDRFFNGDKTNDKISGLKDQAGNLYDESVVLNAQPASGYNGGDIKGIQDKLQYIKDLGFTAIWMTPPVKCEIQDGPGNYHGYHGYWASDFTKVDSHMGTLKQYQDFVEAAHDAGLYVIQDIVVNHLGDYQQIPNGKDVTDAVMKANEGKISATDFYLGVGAVPFSHPEQLPWALNHINDLTYDEWKNNAFYHYNSEISDYTNQTDMWHGQSSNLDDMKTEDPVVRNLLRGYFRYWIDKAGIDGYRIDTALYVEPEFFEGFINSTESNNMGVREYGKSKGKDDFINFGEAFSSDESVVGSYTGGKNGNARMDGMIYFPLRNAISDTISSGSKTSKISEVLKNRYDTSKGIYKDPNRLVTFIDNHDVDRWGKVTKGNIAMTKAAYGILYTIPGIPQVYYGSEQGFEDETRAGMFQGSFLKDGQRQTKDLFDVTSDWYKYFQKLNLMRRNNRVFRYNTLDILKDTNDGAGLFAYLVRETDENGSVKANGKKAIYVMNTSNSQKVLNATCSGLAQGDKFSLIDTVESKKYEGVSSCATNDIEETFVVTNDKKVQIIVPGTSCAIYLMTESGSSSASGTVTLSLTVPTTTVTGRTATIKGKTSVAGKVKIIMNDDYGLAEEVDAVANVEFTKAVDVSKYSSDRIRVILLQEVSGVHSMSEEKWFRYDIPFKLVAQVSDPSGDDNGVGAAKGKITIPTDPPFASTMDIQGVDVYRKANDIRLGVKMGAVSHGWNPTAAQFDHVVFYIFISDGNDATGCDFHPQSNYKLPASFGKWDYMFQCNGWGQAYYKADGASATTQGTATTPAAEHTPEIEWYKLSDNTPGIQKYYKLDWSSYTRSVGQEWADDKPGMVWFTISSQAMGLPADLSGYKIYINTWDFDMGNPRGIQNGAAERYKFGTSIAVADTPLVCDETDNVIVIQ